MASRSRNTSLKPLVFISHYSKEKDVALALQQTLEKAFLNHFDVFVSSDEGSITMGADFENTIRTALDRARFGLCLFTPDSLQRPWINIEFGALWYARKPAVPICFGGQEVRDLPPPYGSKNGLDATNIEALNKLVANVAHALDLSPPPVDWQPFLNAVQLFNDRAAQSWTGTDEERKLFLALYKKMYEPNEPNPYHPELGQPSVQHWATQLNLTTQQIDEAAEVLNEMGLLESIVGHGDVFVRLNPTSEGWRCFFKLHVPNFSEVRQRVIHALTDYPHGVDAAVLAHELNLGYWLVATILQQLHDEKLVRLNQTVSSAGMSVGSISPRLSRA